MAEPNTSYTFSGYSDSFPEKLREESLPGINLSKKDLLVHPSFPETELPNDSISDRLPVLDFVPASKQQVSTDTTAQHISPSNILRMRRSIHTCDYPGCSKSFRRNQHLKRHKRTFHGEGPNRFSCEFCGKDQFSRSDILQVHRRLHARPNGRNRGVEFIPAAVPVIEQEDRSKRKPLLNGGSTKPTLNLPTSTQESLYPQGDDGAVWPGFPKLVPAAINDGSSGNLPANEDEVEEVSSFRALSGTTFAGTSLSVVDDDIACFTGMYGLSDDLAQEDDKPSNEVCLQTLFPHADRGLQIISQVRQLIVSLNPALNFSNQYLADRIAYNYTAQAHKLEQGQHLRLGIQELSGSRPFQAFVCTWRDCQSGAFSSVEDWIAHTERHRGKKMSIDETGDDHDDFVCKFCRATVAWDLLDEHVAEHLILASKAFLDGTWKGIKDDPSVFLKHWHTKAFEPKAAEDRNDVSNTRGTDYQTFPRLSQPIKVESLLTSSATAASSMGTQPVQTRKFEQIGMAQVQIKLVLSPCLVGPSDVDDGQNDSDSFSETSEDQEADCGNGGSATGEGAWPSDLQQTSSISLEPGSSRSGGGFEKGSDNQDDEERGRKRRKGQKDPFKSGNRPRLACPYQAFEPDKLDCFKRGPQNRLGGCENFYRLRQHLARRHMASNRCGRCWRSFDHSPQHEQHTRAGTCEERQLTVFERLMSSEKEIIVNQRRSGTSDVEAWWAIFKLLIPDVEGQDVDTLQYQYSPYYVHRDTTIMIPAIGIPDSLFDMPPSQAMASPSDMLDNASLDLAANTNAAQPDPAAFFSQDFSVPVFQVPNHPEIGGLPEVAVSGSCSGSPSSSMAALPDHFSAWTQPGRSTPPTSSASTKSGSGSTAGGVSQTQLERNLIRLKAQYNQKETENTQLRRDKSTNRQDLKRAEQLLEYVLGSDDLSQENFNKLSQVLDILLGIKSKLV